MLSNPLLAHGYYLEDDDVTFIRLDAEVTIRQKAKEVVAIIRFCNARNSLDEIRASSGLDDSEFDDLFDVLCAQRIVVDGAKLSKGFHAASQYPLLIPGEVDPPDCNEAPVTDSLEPVPVSTLANIASERKSTRFFGQQPIRPQDLSGLLDAMYGCAGPNRTAPSAGGYHGLSLYVCVVRSLGQLGPGIYQYQPRQHGLSQIQDYFLGDSINVMFNVDDEADNISAIICIAGNHAESNRKYPNRSYRYQLIEAGHAAQNAYLYAAESGIGIVERGGFVDSTLATVLDLDFPEEFVITTLAVGSIPDREPDQEAVSEFSFSDELAPLIVDLKFSTYHIDDYLMPRVIAFCTSNDPWPNPLVRDAAVTTGVAVNTNQAMIRAVAESVERLACAEVAISRVAARRDITDPVIDLIETSPLHPAYLERAGLVSFSETDVREWAEGTLLSGGKRFYAPIDQVCFPFHSLGLERRPCYSATSSGVAAHISKGAAIEGAIYELLERDAVCVHWYAGVVPEQIPATFFSRHLQDRIRAFQRASASVVRILNLTLDTLPIVVVTIQSKEGGLIAGSACRPDWDEACTKALDEAEPMYHLKRLQPFEPVALEDVRSPDDHGNYWWDPANAGKINWFFDGTINEPTSRQSCSVEAIAAQFNIGIIEKQISPNFHQFSIQRALSNKLIPITFGRHSAQIAHPRLEMLELRPESETTEPHFLA